MLECTGCKNVSIAFLNNITSTKVHKKYIQTYAPDKPLVKYTNTQHIFSKYYRWLL